MLFNIFSQIIFQIKARPFRLQGVVEARIYHLLVRGNSMPPLGKPCKEIVQYCDKVQTKIYITIKLGEGLNVKRIIAVIGVSEIVPEDEVGELFKLGFCTYDHVSTSITTSSSINHLPSSSYRYRGSPSTMTV